MDRRRNFFLSACAEVKTPVVLMCKVIGLIFLDFLLSSSASASQLEAGRSGLVSSEKSATRLLASREMPRSQLPFWKTKPEVIRRMREERAIMVSVKQESVESKPAWVRLRMQGAGWVSRAKDLSFEIAQNYPRLKEVSEHFRVVEYDPAKKQLFLITEALGYQARMLLQITPVSEDWRSELQWEVIWGHFKGMKGLIGFERVAENRTEVALQAVYEADELPLPKALVGLALEVITQKVAEKMRTFLETQVPVPLRVMKQGQISKGDSVVRSGASVQGSASVVLPQTGVSGQSREAQHKKEKPSK